MPSFKWTIDARDLKRSHRRAYKVWDRYFKNCEIDRQKYYEGFNVGREKEMFQEELKDLELVYKHSLVQVSKQIEDCLPSLLHYMEEFVDLNKQSEAIRDKLDTLLEKAGRKSQEQGSGPCCSEGGCNE